MICSNRFNRSRIRTVVVAAVTSNLRLGEAPGNVTLDGPGHPLPKAFGGEREQLLTVDRTVLDESAGALAARDLRPVDDGLRLVLDV